VVSALPQRLVRAFGAGEHYTFLQAKRAITDLRLGKGLEPYAYAAACTFRELESQSLPLSATDYQNLRTELAILFYLRRADFTIRDLLATPYSSHTPAGADTTMTAPTYPGSGDFSGVG
jgi:hypothetical protein